MSRRVYLTQHKKLLCVIKFKLVKYHYRGETTCFKTLVYTVPIQNGYPLPLLMNNDFLLFLCLILSELSQSPGINHAAMLAFKLFGALTVNHKLSEAGPPA